MKLNIYHWKFTPKTRVLSGVMERRMACNMCPRLYTDCEWGKGTWQYLEWMRNENVIDEGRGEMDEGVREVGRGDEMYWETCVWVWVLVQGCVWGRGEWTGKKIQRKKINVVEATGKTVRECWRKRGRVTRVIGWYLKRSCKDRHKF